MIILCAKITIYLICTKDYLPNILIYSGMPNIGVRNVQNTMKYNFIITGCRGVNTGINISASINDSS